MVDDERDEVRRLDELRDLEPPAASTVDVDRAVRTGRRRRRTRSALAGTVIAGVTVVLLFVAPTLVDQVAHEPPTRPATNRSEFDARVRTFEVGSAGGFTPAAYQTGRTWQRVYLRDAGTDDYSTGLDRATVTMYAKGQVGEPEGTSAPAVNGHRAVWTRTPVTGEGGTEIAWEWSPGAWAFALLRGEGGDTRTLAHRVALSVWPADRVAVRTPFTVARSALGDTDRVVGTVGSVGVSTGPPMTSILLEVPGAPDGWLAVGVQRKLASGDVPGLVGADARAETEVDGHPAAQTETGLVLFEAGDGYVTVVEASDRATLERAGGRAALARIATSVDLVDDTGDASTWPAEPLR